MNGSKSVVRLGIDLGKNSFYLWGVNEQDEPVLKKKVRRSALLREVANLPACLIGLEACSGAHHWGRAFSRHGHEVRLMALLFVKGYIKSNQNAYKDAEGICEAVGRAIGADAVAVGPALRAVAGTRCPHPRCLTATRRGSESCT